MTNNNVAQTVRLVKRHGGGRLTSPDLRSRGRIDSWLPLAPVLVSAALISAVIVTLGAPLIPLIQQGFAISEEQAQWSYTITLLVAAACTPIFGRLADGRHRRAVTALVCGLVALGCVIAAMADTFPMLLVGRGLQGLGVSLVAMTIAAARAYLPPRNARSTVALLSITTALGAGISYPLTTAVADHFGMSAAFALAAVFAAIVGLLVVLRLPSAFEGAGHRPDVVGALLLATGVTAYLLAITHGNAWGWSSLPVLGLGLLGTLIVAVWVAWELHIDYPLVRLPLLADRRGPCRRRGGAVHGDVALQRARPRQPPRPDAIIDGIRSRLESDGSRSHHDPDRGRQPAGQPDHPVGRSARRRALLAGPRQRPRDERHAADRFRSRFGDDPRACDVIDRRRRGSDVRRDARADHCRCSRRGDG